MRVKVIMRVKVVCGCLLVVTNLCFPLWFLVGVLDWAAGDATWLWDNIERGAMGPSSGVSN